MENFKYFVNDKCEFFPCHQNVKPEEWSCLFCYCPLYLVPNCGGDFSILESGVKNCMDCTLPHKRENWQYIVDKLNEWNKTKEEHFKKFKEK